MILHLLLLLIGLGVLVKGADWFVDGAAQLARRVNLSPLAVGLTVVAFGTSLPELFVNLAAGISAATDIGLGNVVGSNIANILLVLGISAMIRPLGLSKGVVWKAIPYSLLAAAILWVMASDLIIDGWFFSAISRSDGLILLVFFGLFMAIALSIAAPVAGLPYIPALLPGRFNATAIKMLLGFCGLLFGGRMTVDNGAGLAMALEFSPAIVGLTVVAVGTSLPELATSVSAARRGAVEIAVGNVVGSTIFNVFFILGASAVIQPLPIDPATHMDLAVMTAASIFMLIVLFAGSQRIMGRMEGALAILIYCIYLGFLLFSV